MERTSKTLDRRDFLKTGLGAAAIGALASDATAAPAAKKEINYSGAIPTRKFGKTGYTFPILGHGGSAMMAKEYRYYGLDNPPTPEDRVKMVRDAYDKGIRYFDTARIYQESEELMGKALKDVRDKVYLASKVMITDPKVDITAAVRTSVETSLKTIGTDYIDVVQVHGPSIEQLKYDGGMKMHDEIAKLREEGKVHFIGLTGHNAFDEMHKMISTGGFDQVLIEYGYFRKGYNTRHSEYMLEWRENCVAKAHELDMGIVAMKVLGAWIFNHNSKNVVQGYDPEALKKLPGAAIRWVLQDPRICMLNIGVSYPGDMDMNIATITSDTSFTLADRQLLADFSAKAYLEKRVQDMPVV